MTGIFIPENYVPTAQVYIILYQHGYRSNGTCGPEPVTIDRYWGSSCFRLREQTNSSGKNVILVAPTLGPKSQTGDLTMSDSQGFLKGFENYLGNVLAALRKHRPYQNESIGPSYRYIILACHSGGGEAMRQIAFGKRAYADRICECWGFDCLYSKNNDPVLWPKWAQDHLNASLFIYYIDNDQPPAKNSKKLSRNRQSDNVFIEISKPGIEVKHCWVPTENWGERLYASAFLGAKATTKGGVSEAHASNVHCHRR